ncbi:MAG: hypothetical protein GXY16_03000 [Syntrophomonadaceae bacterium]|nr:hypothetical protein [Syntrophomonadaceae bacterium]
MMEQNSLIGRLLENNMENTNRLVFIVMLILVTLIIPVTSYMEYRGWTSGAMSQRDILLVAAVTAVILLLLYIIIMNYGRQEWTRWVSMFSVFLVFIVFRIPSHNAVETHALFYLVIVLAIFYFDYRMVLYAAALCILGDFLLQLYFIKQIPAGSMAIQLSIRYLNYLWVGIAAALGTRAMRNLLQLSTELKGEIDRLQEDIDKERQLERARKEFMAAVSHELKTPLALVQGYAEAVRDGVKPEKQTHYMDVIIDEVQDMGDLITNMLDLTQLENGYVKLNWQGFNPELLIDRLVARYKPLWEEKNLQVVIKTTGDAYTVWGDEMQIEHAMVNLFRNAVQHTPPGGNLLVELLERDAEIFLYIENEGIHISESDMKKIWLPFYRQEKSRSKEYGGTGLGLTIAQNIFNLHHSDYGVENTDQGVRFYFSLKKQEKVE